MTSVVEGYLIMMQPDMQVVGYHSLFMTSHSSNVFPAIRFRRSKTPPSEANPL